MQTEPTTTARGAGWRKMARVALGWLVGAGLLALMLRAVDVRSLWAMAQRVPLALWLAAAALWWGGLTALGDDFQCFGRTQTCQALGQQRRSHTAGALLAVAGAAMLEVER